MVDYAADGTYSTHLWGEESVRRVMTHDPAVPLFMVVSYQAVHGPRHTAPFQYDRSCPARGADMPYNDTLMNSVSPVEWVKMKRSIDRRMNYTGVVTAMDNAIENLTAALHFKGMLDNSLIVFTTDNGASTIGKDAWGSSNFPLRGGKHTIWEGGTRGVGAVWGRPLVTPVFRPYVRCYGVVTVTFVCCRKTAACLFDMQATPLAGGVLVVQRRPTCCVGASFTTGMFRKK